MNFKENVAKDEADSCAGDGLQANFEIATGQAHSRDQECRNADL